MSPRGAPTPWFHKYTLCTAGSIELRVVSCIRAKLIRVFGLCQVVVHACFCENLFAPSAPAMTPNRISIREPINRINPWHTDRWMGRGACAKADDNIVEAPTFVGLSLIDGAGKLQRHGAAARYLDEFVVLQRVEVAAAPAVRTQVGLYLITVALAAGAGRHGLRPDCIVHVVDVHAVDLVVSGAEAPAGPADRAL